MRGSIAIPVALAILVGALSFDGEFVYDDKDALIQNPVVNGEASILEAWTRDFWGRPIGGRHQLVTTLDTNDLVLRLESLSELAHSFSCAEFAIARPLHMARLRSRNATQRGKGVGDGGSKPLCGTRTQYRSGIGVGGTSRSTFFCIFAAHDDHDDQLGSYRHYCSLRIAFCCRVLNQRIRNDLCAHACRTGVAKAWRRQTMAWFCHSDRVDHHCSDRVSTRVT